MSSIFQEIFLKSHLNIAYFGSHLLNDLQAIGELNVKDSKVKWDAIAVVEELWNLDHDMDYGEDPELIEQHEEFFGKFFFLDEP